MGRARPLVLVLLIALAIVLIGCGDDASPPAGTDAGTTPGTDGGVIDAALGPPPDVGPCAEQMTLVGLAEGGITAEERRSVTLDTAGSTFCLTLDARTNIHVAHFYADTARELGVDVSSFELFLFDANGALLRRGRDESFIPSNVFASVEHGVEVGTTLEARLVARTKSGVSSATTEVRIALFEPFE